MGLISRNKGKDNSAIDVKELSEMLRESQEKLQFFLFAIRALLFFVKDFSLDVKEIDADRFKKVIDGLTEINQHWDFAHEWGLLHHILPEKRNKYVNNVWQILNPGAKYLSLCFSEKDKGFEGSGKYRNTQFGSTLYFSSEDELRDLFSPEFRIIDLRTVEIAGKFEPRIFNYVFMEKKQA